MFSGTIIGQEKALNILRGYLDPDRFQGAFLLSGPEGVGKKLIALELAKALNCLKTDALNHPDIHLIERGRSDITIDDIRQIQRASVLRPYQARKSVFILDNAHRLNPESANALLKVLEEPPASSVFFLLTDKPELLFDTVVSRCKQVKCCALPRRRLQEHLIRERGFSAQDAHYAAYFCEGSLGRALLARESGLLEQKNRLIDSFMDQSSDRRFFALDTGREEIVSLCTVLAGWFRDICLIKAGGDEGELINLDRLGELKMLAARVSYAHLWRSIKVLTESVIYVEQNLNTRLLLGNMAVQIRALTQAR